MIALSSLDLTIIVFYFMVILLVGYFAQRRRKSTDDDYFLTGRRLTLPLFVLSLTATFYGGVLGIGEFTYLYGISNWVTQAFPYYVFAALFAWFMAGRIRRLEIVSIPDALREHYGVAAGYCGSIFVFILSSPAPYILMLATLIQLVFGIPLFWCLCVAAFFSAAYLISGGLRSDLWTDAVECVLMFAGMAVILPFALSAVGGISGLLDALPPLHLTWHGGNSPQYVLVWFFVALWTFVDPSFHQRCAAAASPQVARRGIALSILGWAVFDLLTTTTALAARALLPELESPLYTYPALAQAVLPSGLRGFFYVGMLATIMSTANSSVFLSAQCLARDLYWRIYGVRSGVPAHRHMALGIVATCTLGLALAWFVPSVVGLWYTIATVVVPGLLVPLLWLHAGFSRKPSAALTTLAMLVGAFTAVAWLLVSQYRGAALWGIEPMFPGLLAVATTWGLALIRGSDPADRSR